MPRYAGAAGNYGPAKPRQIRGHYPEGSAQEGDKTAPGIGVISQAVYQDDDRFCVLMRRGRRRGIMPGIIIEDYRFIIVMRTEHPAEGGQGGPGLHRRRKTLRNAAAGLGNYGNFTGHQEFTSLEKKGQTGLFHKTALPIVFTGIVDSSIIMRFRRSVNARFALVRLPAFLYRDTICFHREGVMPVLFLKSREK
jgi:hypothetical protein